MKIKGTSITPEVDLTFSKRQKTATGWVGTGWIRGRLYHGAIFEFFKRISDHLEREFANHQGRAYLIEIELVDYPSNAAEPLGNLLKMIQTANKGGVDVKVTWKYNANSESQTKDARMFKDDYQPCVEIEPFSSDDD
jgi:hypothetical protein